MPFLPPNQQRQSTESVSEKKFENRLIFGEVVGKSLMSCFFDSQCRSSVVVMLPCSTLTRRRRSWSAWTDTPTSTRTHKSDTAAAEDDNEAVAPPGGRAGKLPPMGGRPKVL